MIVALFFLTDVRYGGFVSYTTHLMRALESRGHTGALYRITTRDEKKPRAFADGTVYRNITAEHASVIAKHTPSAVVCAYQKQYPAELETLLRAGAVWVVHDPTELKGAGPLGAAKAARRIIVIRPAMDAFATAAGITTARFVPHPYVRRVLKGPRAARAKTACSVSRFDWDKNVHLTLEASSRLPKDHRVNYHGSANTLYVNNKLQQWRETWDEQYRGAFPREAHHGVAISDQYFLSFDMSTISGDGGGTQYSFFEAWDAGCTLVLHRDWLRTKGATLVEGVHCLAAETPDEVEALIRTQNTRGITVSLPGAEGLLQAHGPENIVPAFIEALA